MATETPQLNISITLELSKLIRKKIRSGQYASASEVMREGLRRLEQEDLLGEQTAIVDPDDVVSQVRKGMDYVAKGDYTDLKSDQELRDFFADIIARGTRRLSAKPRVAQL